MTLAQLLTLADQRQAAANTGGAQPYESGPGLMALAAM